MVIKKREFIDRYLEVIRKALEESLPDEAFLFEMQEKAGEKIYNLIKHIRDRWGI
jgi:hypothetical protein